MKRLRIMSAGVLGAWAGLALADPVRLGTTPIELPDRIGPLTSDGQAHGFGDPALGVSYQYRGDGLHLNVFVYDAGLAAVPDGADTAPACREFESARRGVADSYQDVRVTSDRLVRVNAGEHPLLVREAGFEFQHEQHHLLSYLWVTAAAGHFIKLRFSADVSLRDELPDARRALLTALATAAQPHLAPAPPEPEPGTSLSFDLNGKPEADMAGLLLYLTMLSQAAEESPETRPVCGGEYLPGFEQDVGLFRALADADVHASSKWHKLLVRAEEAGFLEEFIWSELHRETWGKTPPDGLSLQDYQPWRRKNVKRFKRPQFGTLTFDHPRPLPVEPLEP